MSASADYYRGYEDAQRVAIEWLREELFSGSLCINSQFYDHADAVIWNLENTLEHDYD